MRLTRHIPILLTVVVALLWTVGNLESAQAGLKVRVVKGSNRVSSRRHDDRDRNHDRDRKRDDKIVNPTYRPGDFDRHGHIYGDRVRNGFHSGGSVIVGGSRHPRASGYYRTVTEPVLVSPAHYQQQYMPPIVETRYDRYGRLYQHVVRQGYYQQVWVPATYRTVTRRVWVPVPRYRGRSRGSGIRIHFDF